MASKSELQNVLKEKYGINKNISQPLSVDECERLVFLLEREPSASRLIESFAEKNASLGHNNRDLGGRRNRAESKLEALKEQLESALPSNREKQLEQEKKELEAKIWGLTSQNQELLKVNDDLKKDNKALKTYVDAIRLNLLTGVKQFMPLSDSEFRKAILKWITRSIE